MDKQCLAAWALVAAAMLAPATAGAAQRVFVKSTGNDANAPAGCLFTNPCRSFAAAMTAVDPGGEIVALDAAGYGAVTVDKSVTIVGNPGVFAGIASSANAAVFIDTPGVDVVLRGLHLNGVGAQFGVLMQAGASLTVENCVISNFAVDGIRVSGTGIARITDTVVRRSGFDGVKLVAGARGSLSRVRLSGNARAGLLVQDGATPTTTRGMMSDSDSSGNDYGAVSLSTAGGGATRLAVVRSTLSNNGLTGFYTVLSGGSSATAAIGSSIVTSNGIGMSNQGTEIASQGNNHVSGNGTNIVGVITAAGNL